MRFETTTGKFVTAESHECASSIAAQYGMGELKSAVADIKRAPVTVRDGDFAAWDDVCQAARYVGTLSAAASAVYDDSDLQVVFYENGKPKKLNRAESALVRKMMQEGE
jgi:hypothetical protein